VSSGTRLGIGCKASNWVGAGDMSRKAATALRIARAWAKCMETREVGTVRPIVYLLCSTAAECAQCNNEDRKPTQTQGLA
jgi:hypothetical protein